MAKQYDENLLLAYVEEDLDSPQRAQVEQWMAEDDHLARVLRAMLADRHLLQDVDDPTPPGWVLDEVEQHLERMMLVDSPPRDARAVVIRQRHAFRRVLVGLSVAAMFAVVAGVVVSSLMNIDDREVAMLEKVNQRGAGAGADRDEPDILTRARTEPSDLDDASTAPGLVRMQEPVRSSPAQGSRQAPSPQPTHADAAPVQPEAVMPQPAEAVAGAAAPEAAAPPDAANVISGLPHPQVHAGVGDTREHLLQQPPPVTMSPIAELLSTIRRIQEDPTMAPQYELHVAARDAAAVERWMKQQAAAAQSDAVRRDAVPLQLKTARQPKAKGDGPQPRHFELTLPVDRLDDLAQELLRDPSQVKVRLERRAVLAAGELPAPAGAQKPQPVWPSLEPDYGQFLQQQLPEFASPQAAPAPPVKITLPLVIEPLAPPAN